ncbi:hypothetical protein [Devosia sp. RR2S18]|uniref:hypothetical protein n=1 Tax=Devosia rhizosphaerae TaxID=3049774 RepID=UPI0025411B68|nr:hypothetical protein [Devosia sp. RR2S18]WIJ23518.1 hypothetical protein QOV41_10550 [Devosia sp. RR2S18]
MANDPKNTGRPIDRLKREAGRESQSGNPVDEFELSSDVQGKNSLQGNDQESVNNERHAQAEGKGETDGIIESHEKLDKDVRAERDLGKGNRSS